MLGGFFAKVCKLVSFLCRFSVKNCKIPFTNPYEVVYYTYTKYIQYLLDGGITMENKLIYELAKRGLAVKIDNRSQEREFIHFCNQNQIPYMRRERYDPYSYDENDKRSFPIYHYYYAPLRSKEIYPICAYEQNKQELIERGILFINVSTFEMNFEFENKGESDEN